MAPLILSNAPPAAAQGVVKGEASAVVENGFARLVFRLEEEVESQVRLSNNVLTVTFSRPIEVNIDRIAAGSAGYISVARRDPDRKGLRFAIARKVTMNSMAAGERVFVDLLPDNWTGLAPGLPREVIEDLARRAREAERRTRQQRTLARQNRLAPVRVRIVTQPTFTRYVFELPELIGVSADNVRDKLTLTFDALLRFDLSDAKATMPRAISTIDSEADQDSVVVRFAFSGKVDVRTFREDNSYVVDVGAAEQRSPRADGSVRSDELGKVLLERRAPVEASHAPEGAAVAPPHSPPATPVGLDRPSAPAPRVAVAGAEPHSAAPPPPPVAVDKSDPAAAPDKKSETPPSGPLLASRPGGVTEAVLPAERPASTVPRPATVPAAPDLAAKDADRRGPVMMGIKRQGDVLSLTFPFSGQTPAAVFPRGDTLWLVFDTAADISVAGAPIDMNVIKSASFLRQRGAAIVRVVMSQPKLVTVGAEGTAWTVTLGNDADERMRQLTLTRNTAGGTRTSVVVPFEDPREIHRLEDPDAGDALFVVTSLAPTRGFTRSYDFVEFRTLTSNQGLVVQPLSDDVSVELATDKIMITRPSGLTLSSATSGGRAGPVRRQVFDSQSWGYDRQAPFKERDAELLAAAAAASESKRSAARLALARFYIARDRATEAKGVLDVELSDHPPTPGNLGPLILRAVANIMLWRMDDGLKDLSHPTVGNAPEATPWRALAQARLGRFAEARDSFRAAESIVGGLPLELQRLMRGEMARVLVEVGDATGAVSQFHEYESIGIPQELEPASFILSGRIAEGIGQPDDAQRAYLAAAESDDRQIAAKGKIRQIALQLTRGTAKRAEAVADLETLTAVWRGDETEVEALQLLARLYMDDSRYRDAFHVMRTVLTAHPNSETTRRIQDEAMATFDSLFLSGKGDSLPVIEALALFYDYRDLTPIGRRGDEMIRRLADRLVAVDLLDQAAELLQHQVDNRLQGAARAQIASRLAVIYLMNRKPDRALATLRASRINGLNEEMRTQRMLLEGRALSQIGRQDMALEIIANLKGKEATRLRSDIHWAAKKWAAVAEQIELLCGDRWKEFEPLNDTERVDVLRGAAAYVLAGDSLGTARFREKFLPKMGDGADYRTFDLLTKRANAIGTNIRELARAIASTDTLDAFMRDMRARYPETGAMPSSPGPAGAAPLSAPPQAAAR